MRPALRAGIAVAGSSLLFSIAGSLGNGSFFRFIESGYVPSFVGITALLYLATGVGPSIQGWPLGWRRVFILAAPVISLLAALVVAWVFSGARGADLVWTAVMALALPAAALMAWDWVRSGGADPAGFVPRDSFARAGRTLMDFRVPGAVALGVVALPVLAFIDNPEWWTNGAAVPAMAVAICVLTGAFYVLPDALVALAGLPPKWLRVAQALVVGSIGLGGAAFLALASSSLNSGGIGGVVLLAWIVIVDIALLISVPYLTWQAVTWVREGFKSTGDT
ncbi:MAG TPA: hypothetical protein VGB53_16940 [Rubricoccaceae bacterium]|jgi:hypothetical protein